jgi:hypothetical protein
VKSRPLRPQDFWSGCTGQGNDSIVVGTRSVALNHASTPVFRRRQLSTSHRRSICLLAVCNNFSLPVVNSRLARRLLCGCCLGALLGVDNSQCRCPSSAHGHALGQCRNDATRSAVCVRHALSTWPTDSKIPTRKRQAPHPPRRPYLIGGLLLSLPDQQLERKQGTNVPGTRQALRRIHEWIIEGGTRVRNAAGTGTFEVHGRRARESVAEGDRKETAG